MSPFFTSAPTKHVARPLLPAPCPVTLPVLLTNIIPEQLVSPRILTDIDSNRTPSPPPGPRRAPAPAPRRAPTPAPLRRAPTPPPPPPRRQPAPESRDSSLTPIESDPDSDSDSSSDSGGTRKKPQSQIPRPSNANIQTVKLEFKGLFPDLTEQEQEAEYTAFRTQVDTLCARYLLPSKAFSHQDKDDLRKVYKKLTEKFEWISEYDNSWPAAVCLQGKLHNTAKRAVEKSTKKVISALTGLAPSRSSSRPRNKVPRR